MKVFISWSGERSKAVATLLDWWIQCVIQAVKPWMSSKDIDRGALWFTEISEQLSITGIGILCLTKENKNKPWILFEAGALAKGLSSGRVIPLLIDLESTDLENPLAQFNYVLPDRTGIWNLVRTINGGLKELSLSEQILLKVFDSYWNQFEKEFQNIITTTPISEVVEERKENDIMLEVLLTVRSFDKRLRNIELIRDHNVISGNGGYSGFSGTSKESVKVPTPDAISLSMSEMEDLIIRIAENIKISDRKTNRADIKSQVVFEMARSNYIMQKPQVEYIIHQISKSLGVSD